MNVFNEAFEFQGKFKIPRKDPDVAWWWPNIELNGIVPPRTFEKLDEEECGTTSPPSDLKQNSRVIGRTTNDCREERDEARFFAAKINCRVKRIRVPDTTGNRFAAMNNSEIAPRSSEYEHRRPYSTVNHFAFANVTLRVNATAMEFQGGKEEWEWKLIKPGPLSRTAKVNCII